MKKITVIGAGTAGVLSLSHFLRWTDWEIEWYNDTSIKPQAVGEGSTLDLPQNLYFYHNFRFDDLEKIDGTYKLGIRKKYWGELGKDFIHYFPPGSGAYHFNAVKLQNYIRERVSSNPRVRHVDGHVSTYDQIDSNYIMDCSGKPSNYDDFEMSDFIPVNSVYVTQCWWDHAEFNYTLAIARPYGWVFGIPLQNRCSIGYMYNNNINTLDQVKEDVQHIFEEFRLTPSDTTNAFSFKNYYRKKNFDGRVAYNGNASFFLEPLEATSIGFMDKINRRAFDVWNDYKDLEAANVFYTQKVKEIENVIMLHYAAGSVFDTEFWHWAQERGQRNISSLLNNRVFKLMLASATGNMYEDMDDDGDKNYGTWARFSFQQNFQGLGLKIGL
jgi:hypothetical protein